MKRILTPQTIFTVCLFAGLIVGGLYGQTRLGTVIGAVAGAVLALALRFARQRKAEPAKDKETDRE